MLVKKLYVQCKQLYTCGGAILNICEHNFMVLLKNTILLRMYWTEKILFYNSMYMYSGI